MRLPYCRVYYARDLPPGFRRVKTAKPPNREDASPILMTLK